MAASAAAAAVGVRRAREARGIGPPPRLPTWASGISATNGGPTSGIRAACCTSVVLLCTGIGLVIASIGNDRQVRVATYDESVRDWARAGRAELEGSAFVATVAMVVDDVNETNGTNGTNITNSTYDTWLGSENLTIPLQANEEMDWSFRDAENGQGIEEFNALKFSTEVDFQTYYPTLDEQNGTSEWTPLPGRDDAPTVRLSFAARTRNGSESVFETGAVPLFYVQRVLPRTPTPDLKCRQVQHGIWRRGHCYVVRALSEVCVQLEMSNESAWQLKVAGGPEGYGCDPLRQWSYTTYLTDPCWGAHRSRSCGSTDPRPPHRVEITVRSGRDPKLVAAELTRDRFDFGTGRTSQLALGIVLLALSGILALPPFLALVIPYVRSWCQSPKVEQQLEALSPAARRVGLEDNA